MHNGAGDADPRRLQGRCPTPSTTSSPSLPSCGTNERKPCAIADVAGVSTTAQDGDIDRSQQLGSRSGHELRLRSKPAAAWTGSMAHFRLRSREGTASNGKFNAGMAEEFRRIRCMSTCQPRPRRDVATSFANCAEEPDTNTSDSASSRQPPYEPLPARYQLNFRSTKRQGRQLKAGRRYTGVLVGQEASIKPLKARRALSKEISGQAVHAGASSNSFGANLMEERRLEPGGHRARWPCRESDSPATIRGVNRGGDSWQERVKVTERLAYPRVHALSWFHAVQRIIVHFSF